MLQCSRQMSLQKIKPQKRNRLSTQSTQLHTINCLSYDEASARVTDEMRNNDIVLHATITTQGNRQHISAMIPMRQLPVIATNEKKDDGDNYNRTPSKPHVKSITSYLKKQSFSSNTTYIIPNITMAIGNNDTSSIRVYTTPSIIPQIKQCIILIPRPQSEDQKFPILDGQHRYLAIKELIHTEQNDPSVGDVLNDMISIVIINETNLEQIHTDFVNLATTRSITKGLKVAWDHNNKLSNLCLEIAETALKAKVEEEATTPRESRAVTVSLISLTVTELKFGKSGIGYQNKLAESLQDHEVYVKHHELCELFFNEWRQAVERIVGVPLEDCESFKESRKKHLIFVSSILQAIARAVYRVGAESGPEAQQRAIKFFMGLDFARQRSVDSKEVVNNLSPFYGTLLLTDGSVPNSFDTINDATTQLMKLWSSAARSV